MSEADGQDNPKFKTSSFSGGGNCVQVAQLPHGGSVIVRHSQQPDSGCLAFSAQEWEAFVAGVKAGEFDPT